MLQHLLSNFRSLICQVITYGKLKSKSKFQTFSSKSGRGRLREMVSNIVIWCENFSYFGREVVTYIHTHLYNNPSYSRILIGSRLWSIRGQTHDWRHRYKVSLCFSLSVLRMKIIFYVTGKKIRYKKVLPRHWTGLRSRKKKDKAISFRKWSRKKISSNLSRQSSETKPSTKLVLVSRKALPYLEFNKPNKHYVSEINLYKKKINFSQSKNNCWHTDWCQEWNIKTSPLKISEIKQITLLSDACFPVRLRAQQRTKYNLLQLTANCIEDTRCLRHYI